MWHQQNQILPKNVHNRQHILLDNYFDIYKFFLKISLLTNAVKKQRAVWILSLLDNPLFVAPVKGFNCSWSCCGPCSHHKPLASNLPHVHDKNEDSWPHCRTWKIRSLCWDYMDIHNFNMSPPLCLNDSYVYGLENHYVSGREQ